MFNVHYEKEKTQEAVAMLNFTCHHVLKDGGSSSRNESTDSFPP